MPFILRNAIAGIAIGSFILAFTGCKKLENNKDFTVENYNGTSDETVAIYGSENDYINSTNAVVTGTASADGTFNFSSSKLKEGNWYYVDAYNSDYTNTNWGQSDDILIGADSTTPRRFKYNSGNKDFVLLLEQTNVRKVLLNNNQGGSTWKAVDALDLQDGTSIWYTLPEARQYVELTISKTHKGSYKYLNGSDTLTTSFTFNNTITGYPTFNLIVDQINLNMFISNTYQNPITVVEPVASTDTILSLINGNLYLFTRK